MKAYLLRLTAAAMIAALVRQAAPPSGAGKTAVFGAGLLVILTAFSPLGQADLLKAVEDLAIGGYADVLTTQPVDQASNALLEELITDSAEAYILDKAEAMGVEARVSLEVNAMEGYPVPWEVEITGDISWADRQVLMKEIESELGIPAQRQKWSGE